MKQGILDAIGAHRDEVVEKALPGVLSHIRVMFEGHTLEQNLMKLQQELDALPEPYRTSVVSRLKAQTLHCENEEDKMTAIMSLLARLYGTTKLNSNRKLSSALVKTKRTLTGNLAASWENLVGRTKVRASRLYVSGIDCRQACCRKYMRLGSIVFPIGAFLHALTAQGGRTTTRTSPSSTLKNDTSPDPETSVVLLPINDEDEASLRRRWRQDLFRSVSVQAPRKETPGRRQSSAISLDTPGSAGRSSPRGCSTGRVLNSPRQSSRLSLLLQLEDYEVSRSEIVRARWQKAVQTQLLLIRMGKENEQLRVVSEKLATQQADEVAERVWAPLFKTPPKTWKEAKIRECLAIGVPPKRRREFWIGMSAWLIENAEPGIIEPFDYVELLVEPCIYWHAIKIDVDRTFPDRALFQRGAGGQKRLFNTMKAYANYDIETGYCQGLHFVAGTFLMQLTEEEAFGVLVPFLYTHSIREQYMHDMGMLKVHLYQVRLLQLPLPLWYLGSNTPSLPKIGLPLSSLQFSRLIADKLPKMFRHFQEHGVEPFFYAAPWFLSLFSSTFPEEFTAVVFDNALLDGMIVVFKVALALFSIYQEPLLASCRELEDTLRFMEREFPSATIGQVMQRTATVDVNATELEKYAAEFTVMEANTIVDIDESVDLTERVSQLTEKLMDSERSRVELERELEMSKQQLNHAKSALQGLAMQNESNEDELRALRKAVLAFSEAGAQRTRPGSAETARSASAELTPTRHVVTIDTDV